MEGTKPFLAHVAEHIIETYGNKLSDAAIVFPNKRAALFMNEYLARTSEKPVWSPAYLTISELFRSQSALTTPDPVKLTCELYKSFAAVTGSTESLDHFYGWGQVILSDFDDIDKNLVDAHRVFINLRDWHEMDDLSFLTQNQKDVLSRFFAGFNPDHQTELKQRFLSLWSKLAEVYDHFRQQLRSQGLAYEGMLQRDVTEQEQLDLRHQTYHFVGFNVLNQTELQLFKRLKDLGRAHFYWDFDKSYLGEADSEAAQYVRQYMLMFPNELDSDDDTIYDNLSKPKDICFVSASTENIQARYIKTWLSQHGRVEAGSRTAIVLADERLLQAVVHALPEDVEVNITTGYPLQSTLCAALLRQLYALQTSGYDARKKLYRLSCVMPVLRHPFATLISAGAAELKATLEHAGRRFVSPERLSDGDDGLSLVFTPPAADTLSVMQWLLSVLKLIARQGPGSMLEQEALFRTYTLVSRLTDLIAAGDLGIDHATLGRLIRQIVGTTTIPFHGEPLKGIQVMGVLETRNLDFDHLLVLSANEGNLPRGLNESSLIPYSIRKAYQLTTADNRAAVYAYHFYRLLQRAGDATLCYNSQTTDRSTGEMSRFMLQLLTTRGDSISRRHLQARQSARGDCPKAAGPSESLTRSLQQCERISPTDINQYLRCQLLFYYKKILSIKEPEPSPDDMPDNRLFGTVFHSAAELAYKEIATPDGIITKPAIESLLKNKPRLDSIIRQAFGSESPAEGITLIHHAAISRYLNNLLQADLRLAPFNIIGLELPIEERIAFSTPQGRRDIVLKGVIDRLDMVGNPPTIRVVDYKTGRAPQRPIKEREEVFGTEAIEQAHSDYYLQAMLYSTLVGQSPVLNPSGKPVSPALTFVRVASSPDYDPVLGIDGQPIADIADYQPWFSEQLSQLLGQIFDPDTPFQPTGYPDRCAGCAFRQLCFI